MKHACAVTVLAALTLAGTAAAAGPAVKHTAGGNATAKASLLTLSDLGKGWTAKSGASSGIQVACTGYQPSGKGVTEIGVAASPSFSGSTAGPFVVQQTSVYGSAAQARAYWGRAVQAALVSCAKQSLAPLTKQGIKVKVVSAGALAIPKVTAMTAGYRVVATLSSSTNKNLKTYLDWVFVGNGSTVTQIVVSSFQKLPAKYEYALAILANKHIADNAKIPKA